MSAPSKSLEIHIDRIEAAMKKAGVWSSDVPDWIYHYTEDRNVDIWQWLQFIHLPMRIKGTLQKPQYLAPKLSRHIQADPKLQDILKLVIELDSISPTIDKKDLKKG